MKNICVTIMASVMVVLLFVMTSEAVPVEAENNELVERTVRSALDEELTDEAIAKLLLRYLEELKQQESEDQIYAIKRFSMSGLSGIDTMSMLNSRINKGKHYRNGGRRRRSLDDLL